MAMWSAFFVLALVVIRAGARNVPVDGTFNEQILFDDPKPKETALNNAPNDQTTLRADAPKAEAPAGAGLGDRKNFIYGGVGGFAGVGAYAGGIGELPLLGGLGGIGEYGGIGGVGGIGGYSGIGGLGGLGGVGGIGGLGGASSLGGLGGIGGVGDGAGAGGAAGVGGAAGGVGGGLLPQP